MTAVQALAGASADLVGAIRAIEADGLLTEQEKARRRQALMSGGIGGLAAGEDDKGKMKAKRSNDVLNLLDGIAPSIPCYPVAPATPADEATLGCHLARRLVQIGVHDVFTVPGDFNLTLLDHLIAEPGLKNIGCCNELNTGYAADGYTRGSTKTRECLRCLRSINRCEWQFRK